MLQFNLENFEFILKGGVFMEKLMVGSVICEIDEEILSGWDMRDFGVNPDYRILSGAKQTEQKYRDSFKAFIKGHFDELCKPNKIIFKHSSQKLSKTDPMVLNLITFNNEGDEYKCRLELAEVDVKTRTITFLADKGLPFLGIGKKYQWQGRNGLNTINFDGTENDEDGWASRINAELKKRGM